MVHSTIAFLSESGIIDSEVTEGSRGHRVCTITKKTWGDVKASGKALDVLAKLGISREVFRSS